MLASSFASALELVREGVAEIHQQEAFAPLFMRKRETPQNGNGAAPEARRRRADGDNGVTRRPSAMSLATRKIMPRNEPEQSAEVRPEELRLLEAMLFASAEPISEKDLAARLPEGTNLAGALERLREDYANRGVNLVRIDGKWTFRTATDLSWLLSKETTEKRKLSRAAIETLCDHRLSPAGDAQRDRGDCAACRPRPVPWTCCWKPAGSVRAAAARRPAAR